MTLVERARALRERSTDELADLLNGDPCVRHDAGSFPCDRCDGRCVAIAPEVARCSRCRRSLNRHAMEAALLRRDDLEDRLARIPHRVPAPPIEPPDVWEVKP